MTGTKFPPAGLPAPGVVLLRDSSPLSPRDDLPPIPLFEGATERGPINDPHLCRSLAEWADIFGVSSSMDHVIGYGVRDFFMRGGDCCYFQRIEDDAMTPRMTCDFNALRRNLAAAYNRHVDELCAAGPYLGYDLGAGDTCAEIGNCIAALLALSSDEGIADLSDAVTLRSPFGKD